MKGKQMLKAIEATQTEKIIYEMLTENTGKHFLDSGGEVGRAWQRNQKNTLEDFKNEPYAVIDPKYGDVSISTFHYLNEHLDFADGLNLAFELFAKQYPNEPWREIISLWFESLGVIEDDSLEGNTWEFNTYNFDTFLVSQCLQGSFFTLGTNDYVALQIHGGADVRGGYTAPKIFKGDRWDFITYGDSVSFLCSDECGNTLDIHEGYSAEMKNAYGETEDIRPEQMPKCPCGAFWVA